MGRGKHIAYVTAVVILSLLVVGLIIGWAFTSAAPNRAPAAENDQFIEALMAGETPEMRRAFEAYVEQASPAERREFEAMAAVWGAMTPKERRRAQARTQWQVHEAIKYADAEMARQAAPAPAAPAPADPPQAAVYAEEQEAIVAEARRKAQQEIDVFAARGQRVLQLYQALSDESVALRYEEVEECKARTRKLKELGELVDRNELPAWKLQEFVERMEAYPVEEDYETYEPYLQEIERLRELLERDDAREHVELYETSAQHLREYLERLKTIHRDHVKARDRSSIKSAKDIEATKRELKEAIEKLKGLER